MRLRDVSFIMSCCGFLVGRAVLRGCASHWFLPTRPAPCPSCLTFDPVFRTASIPILGTLRKQLCANGGNLAQAVETLEGVGGTGSGTPAAALVLAGLCAVMGEAAKAAGVVVKAAEASRRGNHVSVHVFSVWGISGIPRG